MAHKGAMKELEFEREVKQKSRDLAFSMTEIFALLLSSHSDETALRTSQVSAVLEGNFLRALRLKAKMILSDSRFKAEFIQPGSGYDSDEMNQDGWTTMDTRNRQVHRQELNPHRDHQMLGQRFGCACSQRFSPIHWSTMTTRAAPR
ncbi:hypothetical protein BX600DRAFT_440723 [Xylariales sp. PMI_506]|nr:hypothetical protein BX600DRAFT_440723 [Xylariales sp. PMI_506]